MLVMLVLLLVLWMLLVLLWLLVMLLMMSSSVFMRCRMFREREVRLVRKLHQHARRFQAKQFPSVVAIVRLEE